ncbi:hypothetical protein [Paenibacillus aceris]|uniref:Uncharacterized protein n=1 Tax=Paenibacillus aceris TaxID=869555 RepID=A0ABS4HQR9_9BACL|nr:hypothetical protein [Paenibacillus aceris]MBP1960957.1 hypothetical protein [Paenibacillus aceris]NHW35376.1 hypothetical protein [Paenibacillus aceris]
MHMHNEEDDDVLEMQDDVQMKDTESEHAYDLIRAYANQLNGEFEVGDE